MTFCFLRELVYRFIVLQKRFSRRCANIAAILAVVLSFKAECRFVGAGVSIYISELFPCKIPWMYILIGFFLGYCNILFLEHNLISMKKRWSCFQKSKFSKFLSVY